MCWLWSRRLIKPSTYQGRDRCIFVALWPHWGHLAKLDALLAGVTGTLWLPPCPVQTSRIVSASKLLCSLESLCFFPCFPFPAICLLSLSPVCCPHCWKYPSRDLAQWQSFCYPLQKNIRSLFDFFFFCSPQRACPPQTRPCSGAKTVSFSLAGWREMMRGSTFPQ